MNTKQSHFYQNNHEEITDVNTFISRHTPFLFPWLPMFRQPSDKLGFSQMYSLYSEATASAGFFLAAADSAVEVEDTKTIYSTF
jgi:hypothetical protein